METSSGRQMISFTKGRGKAYCVWCRLKTRWNPDVIGEIEVEQCMGHPQREHNPHPPNGENERALRWEISLDTEPDLTQVFMFLQTTPREIRHPSFVVVDKWQNLERSWLLRPLPPEQAIHHAQWKNILHWSVSQAFFYHMPDRIRLTRVRPYPEGYQLSFSAFALPPWFHEFLRLSPLLQNWANPSLQ